MDELILPKINYETCTGCGVCESGCPGHAVQMIEKLPSIQNPDKCTYCGICEVKCPTHSIELVYQIMPPDYQ